MVQNVNVQENILDFCKNVWFVKIKLSLQMYANTVGTELSESSTPKKWSWEIFAMVLFSFWFGILGGVLIFQEKFSNSFETSVSWLVVSMKMWIENYSKFNVSPCIIHQFVNQSVNQSVNDQFDHDELTTNGSCFIIGEKHLSVFRKNMSAPPWLMVHECSTISAPEQIWLFHFLPRGSLSYMRIGALIIVPGLIVERSNEYEFNIACDIVLSWILHSYNFKPRRKSLPTLYRWCRSSRFCR